MFAIFKPCKLSGIIDAPPSKSLAHRYLIGAALAGEESRISGFDYSEDILATMDCLRTLGAEIVVDEDTVTVNPEKFMRTQDEPVLECRESGSTLRFFIPLALCLGKDVVFKGSKRLFERPLDVYEELCGEYGFTFKKDAESITLCGRLKSGHYQIRGNVSSQFITGMIFALIYLGGNSSIQIIPPLESKSYVNLSIEALKEFGADIEFVGDYKIVIKTANLHSYTGRIEGDYSNAAFLDAFNYMGSHVEVRNLNEMSCQGDRIYKEYFEKIQSGVPTLDISDCPDLGPVLIALALLKNGAVLTGTDRLKMKESDRGMAMHEELQKLGGELRFGENTIIVPKQDLCYQGEVINGHNDHRIVMAMSLVLTRTGGVLKGADAVRKSYPGFFKDIKNLGAIIEVGETVGKS